MKICYRKYRRDSEYSLAPISNYEKKTVTIYVETL